MDEKKLNEEIDNLRGRIDLAKIDRISRVSKIISLTVVPLMLILFIYGFVKLTGLKSEITETEDLLEKAQTQLKDYKEAKDLLQTDMDLILSTSLNAFGWPVEEIKLEDRYSQKIIESLNANNIIRNIVFNHEFEISSRIIVQYYPKSKDKYKVVAALEEFGFEVNTKNSNPKLLNQKTNSIWFGKSVPIENVKLVAFTLIRAGVEIKFIRQADILQSNKIIIGTSYPHEHKSRILVSKIYEISEFEKCPTLSSCN